MMIEVYPLSRLFRYRDSLDMGYTSLTAPFQISKKNLDMMDSAMENLDKGIVSGEIDLSEFEDSPDV